MEKWEYKSEGNISTEKMNELGLQGWELVSTNVLLETNNPNRFDIYYFFKRKI